jgi:hypothetical protein
VNSVSGRTDAEDVACSRQLVSEVLPGIFASLVPRRGEKLAAAMIATILGPDYPGVSRLVRKGTDDGDGNSGQ